MTTGAFPKPATVAKEVEQALRGRLFEREHIEKMVTFLTDHATRVGMDDMDMDRSLALALDAAPLYTRECRPSMMERLATFIRLLTAVMSKEARAAMTEPERTFLRGVLSRWSTGRHIDLF